MSNHVDMYYWDGTNFVPWGGTVSAAVSVGSVAVSGGTVNIAGTTLISGTVVTGAGTQPISGTVGVSGTVPVSIPGTPAVSVTAGTLTMLQAGTVETTPYTTVKSGELAIGTAAGGTATASIACKLVRFKARHANLGTVFLGGGTTVTVPDGTTDVTTGLSMIAGEDTGWIPASNTNQFYFISSGTANAVTYLAVM